MQTFTGLDYLKIDNASSFGLDKKTWAERLDASEDEDDEPPQAWFLFQWDDLPHV